MDFGDFPKLKLPTSYVSTGAIIQRPDGAILTALRENEPWKGCRTIGFGGYVDPPDVDILTATARECHEETGLEVRFTRLVGIYGPECYHYILVQKDDLSFRASSTGKSGQNRPVVSFVLAGEIIGGYLVETDEMKRFTWMQPKELLYKELTFDHALHLEHFLDKSRHEAGRLALRLFLK